MNAVKQDFPRRILHIVAGMNTGGAETWLMHVLRCINRDQFHFDFFVHAATPSFYDDEIRSLGSRIITNPQPQFANIHGYSRNFLRTLKEFGPYDTVHSHVHHFSGVVLMLARIAGVPQRIAHSHTDLSLHEKNARFSRKMHWYIMKRLINMNATVGLGCSRVAAQNLFGDAWESDPRYQVLFCGIDMEPFKEPVNRNVVRCELNIPDDAFVIGHVGRFDGPKNHTFLIDIFFEVSKYEPKAVLLLVGDGPMRMDMEEKTVQLGLAGKVVFAGVRADVPRLLKGAMDIFVFPSLHEGLPLTLIEAQSAGLAILCSSNITHEVDMPTAAIKRESLSNQAQQWASHILDVRKNSSGFREKPVFDFSANPFAIDTCINGLGDIYARYQ